VAAGVRDEHPVHCPAGKPLALWPQFALSPTGFGGWCGFVGDHLGTAKARKGPSEGAIRTDLAGIHPDFSKVVFAPLVRGY
jgi:hypothetical protein